MIFRLMSLQLNLISGDNVNLSVGGYYRQCGEIFGYAECTVQLYLHEVADFLFDISPQFVRLPQPQEFPRLASRIQLTNGDWKNVILYIDGMIVKIQRPAHAGDAFFCGRRGKSCDALNVQYVADKFGMVRFMITGIPGSTPDKTATEWSPELIQFMTMTMTMNLSVYQPTTR